MNHEPADILRVETAWTRVVGSLCIVVDDHLHVPNGVAVTGDGETLYMAEMYKNRILSYSIGGDKKTFFNKQVHISIPDLHGKPDGLLCDADGNLWVAHWRGWQVSRYDRHGHQNLVISTPFATPTCLCWKGSAEKEMIVTTATLELSADELRNSQHPGAVYLLRL
jgi:sugar lactone lactonase YvrE